jgi:putative protease
LIYGMERKDFEIMAPVGSYESLSAALQGGADSVYFGVEGLNMRARSSANFTLDDLRNIVGICEEKGVKTYLTVNTIIYNNELQKMHEVIDCAKEAGVSAIIASDLAAILYAHSRGVEIHISTQCNITNYETVRFYAQYADVMVLAREMDMNQVADIYRRIQEEQLRGPKGELIRIEMFAHGALCMAVSGKCYLSLHEKNASANRGACFQICRRAYTVKDREGEVELDIENEYIMSPKDLCTIGFLNKMIDAGVRVFKLEGRARPAEYVLTVCRCYDEALKAILDRTYSAEKIEIWKQRLATVFNRGFWDGYYLGQRLGEWSEVYGSKATRKKIALGKVTNYFSNLQVGEFKLESFDLSVGDEVLIVGETTGVIEMRVPEIRVDLQPVEKVKKGILFSMPVPEKVRRGDKIYKWVETTPDLMQ